MLKRLSREPAGYGFRHDLRRHVRTAMPSVTTNNTKGL